MSADGKFVVIDGIDGSGKGLIANLLVNMLKDEGREVGLISFPQYGHTYGGRLIDNLRKDKSFAKVDARLACLPYALDRREMREHIYSEVVVHRKVLVSDRYESASEIHQGGKIKDQAQREEFLNWLYNLEFNLMGVYLPDLVVLIDMPVEKARELLQAEGKKLDALEEDSEYLTNSRECLLWLAEHKGYPLIHALAPDGSLRTPQEIVQEVYEIVVSHK